MNRSTAVKTAAISLMLFGFTVATEMPVPAKLQGVIFRRIFDYVKTFDKGEVNLLVVYAEEPPEVTSELMESFKKAGLLPTTIEVGELSQKIGNAKAVYILPGVAASQVKKLCLENGILSLSGIPSMVEQGDISISLTLEGGRPLIVVNRSRIETEGHQLSSELLQLAKVIE